MKSNGWRVVAVAVLLLIGSAQALAGPAAATEGHGTLKPIPNDSVTPTQPGSPFRDEGAAVDGDVCPDVCGVPICSPPGRFWLRADNLLWWTSGTNLPPLLINGNADLLYGNKNINNDAREGFRTTLGMWLDCCHVWNLEFDYLNLGQPTSTFNTSSNGVPTLFRPFYDVQNNRPSGEVVADANTRGAFSVVNAGYFQSIGALLSYNVCSCNGCGSCDDDCGSCGALQSEGCLAPVLRCCRTDLLVGPRYYGYSDRMTVAEDLVTLNSITTNVRDYFRAQNDFYGVDFGLRNQLYRGHFSVELTTKIAIGTTHRFAAIAGQTVTTQNGTSLTTNSGVFANGANIGHYSRDVFTMIPELNLEVGYQVTRHVRAYMGYGAMYWGSVWHAAEQYDINVDRRNIPTRQGLPFPAFPYFSSPFWAQGLNWGLECRF